MSATRARRMCANVPHVIAETGSSACRGPPRASSRSERGSAGTARRCARRRGTRPASSPEGTRRRRDSRPAARCRDGVPGERPGAERRSPPAPARRRPQRMELRMPERLVGVDVPHARDHPLVEHTAFSGARRRARRWERKRTVNRGPSGSGPRRAPRYSSSSAGASTCHVPKRRTSRYETPVPSSRSMVARSCVAGASGKPPVMRRCTTSARPLSKWTTRYLPRRSTERPALPPAPPPPRRARAAASGAGRGCVPARASGRRAAARAACGTSLPQRPARATLRRGRRG